MGYQFDFKWLVNHLLEKAKANQPGVEREHIERTLIELDQLKLLRMDLVGLRDYQPKADT